MPFRNRDTARNRRYHSRSVSQPVGVPSELHVVPADLAVPSVGRLMKEWYRPTRDNRHRAEIH